MRTRKGKGIGMVRKKGIRGDTGAFVGTYPSPRWSDFINLAPEKIRVLSPQGLILFANDAAGGAAEIGKSFYSLTDAEDRRRAKEALKGVFKTGEPHRFINPIPEKGTSTWVHRSIEPLNRGKEIFAAVAVSVNPTHCRDAETLLGRLESLGILFETMAEGALLMDPFGKVIEANKAAERILGVKRSDIQSRNYIGPEWEALRRDGTPMPLAEIPSAAAMREQRPVKDVVLGMRRPDDTVRWINVSAVPFKDASGKPAGVVTTFWDVTERIRASEEVRRERDKAQRYLDMAGALIVALDSKGRVTLINREGRELLGYEEQQILGKNWFQNFLPRSVGRETRKVFRSLMQHGVPAIGYYENPVLTKDGKERIITWRNTTLMDDDGNAIGTLSSGIDITERKRAEEALRTSEERYRSLVENANEAIVVAQDNYLKFANSKTEEVTGYTRDELLSIPFIELIHPDDRETVVGRYRKRLRGEELPHVYAFRVVAKNGDVKWLEINAITIPWGGKPATLNFLKDVTEQKKAQEELQRIEERYRAVVEDQTELIFRSRPNGELTFVNNSFCRSFGKSRSQLVGQNFIELVPRRGRQKVIDFIASFSQKNPVGKCIQIHPGSTGERRWIEWTARGLFDKTGTLIELQTVGRDITDQKKVEQELKNHSERLEKLVEQRTSELRKAKHRASGRKGGKKRG